MANFWRFFASCIFSEEKRKKKENRRNHRAKMYWPALIHRAAIIKPVSCGNCSQNCSLFHHKLTSPITSQPEFRTLGQCTATPRDAQGVRHRHCKQIKFHSTTSLRTAVLIQDGRGLRRMSQQQPVTHFVKCRPAPGWPRGMRMTACFYTSSLWFSWLARTAPFSPATSAWLSYILHLGQFGGARGGATVSSGGAPAPPGPPYRAATEAAYDSVFHQLRNHF